ncbi:cell death-inducing p53-target protein 1 homolog [Frieseomelitta varia]|uniref:cell death-inducing p53-target protein 1 homolog n=1 Tax=Frieseomelitta varia TaxID=561572 RepID=UPI001CB68A1A|nr:cell death-inducing p53-target protein 1 homolog [Frieseomelitta varia]XP_043509199.1 cell death-inducing p53-target protein 1 homolog [Frieseomelitta varia]
MEKMGPHPPPPPGFVPAPPPPPTGIYPPPPPYQPSGEPSTVVITPMQFGSEPQHVICPHCRVHGRTTIETGANTTTHLFALLLCIFGLWCCVPCPYCMDSCMAKKHYCSNCKMYLGESK